MKLHNMNTITLNSNTYRQAQALARERHISVDELVVMLIHLPQSRGVAYQTLLRRLSDFQEYEQGWDDGDARPLSPTVVKNFKAVLEGSSDSLLTGWTIFPAANGSLLLEYKPREAGINIGKDDFSYYSFRNGQVEGQNSRPFTAAAVIETMKRLSDD